MLAQILQDMWVDPEILEALSEEQRRILFLKMREEQVRRWTEREAEDSDQIQPRPKTGCEKKVTWSLGLDGNVRVTVIGEVEEFQSSKLLKTLQNCRLQSDHSRGGQRSLSLDSHMTVQHPVQVVLNQAGCDTHAMPGYSSSFKEDSGTAEDDSKDPQEDSGSESGSSTDWAPAYRPHLRSCGSPLALSSQVSLPVQAQPPQERVSRTCEEESPAFVGRVAQLRRAFAGSNSVASVPGYGRPAMPTKAPHLQLVTLR